jgi:outer membrane protein TolC
MRLLRTLARQALPGLAIAVLAVGPPARAGAQGRVRLTLQQALEVARTESPSALLAEHRYRGSYWQYVTFKADYRPSLELDSTPAAWDRTIAQQTLPDGTDAFVARSQANSQVQLSLSKVVTWTGGTFALRSNLARTDAFESTHGTSYYAIPAAISYDQPLFAFNPYTWNLRVEPLRYRETRQQYIEDLEGIAGSTISSFFDLLTAQSTLRDAERELARADTLLTVVRRRFQDRQVPEDDVLQAELGRLNADLRLTRARMDVDISQQRLGTLLGVGEAPRFDLVIATDVPRPRVDLTTAVAQARRNRPTAMAWERQLVEADRSVAQAAASHGYTWLHASYGLSQTSTILDEVYRQPVIDQVASLSVNVPIVDWGRNRARIAVAESQREVTRRQVEQAQSDFDRDVFLRFSQFGIQERQLDLSARADSIAQRRYSVTRERYLAGQSDLNSVNIAQQEMDNSRRGYLDALRSYWAAYYDLRRATLYDFEYDRPLASPEIRF